MGRFSQREARPPCPFDLGHSRNRAEVSPSPPKPTHVRVTYQPSRDGNKGTIIFVLNGTEHTLEYVRRDNITYQIFVLKRKQQELVRLVIPFATLKPLEKQVKFQIDDVNCLFTFKMSAITSIMSVKLEVGGEEVFRT